MLSARTLDRVSDQFRRGYREGYEGTPMVVPEAYGAAGMFANFDYVEGHKAGANDRKWDERRVERS
jgi:hypothetical protein